MTFCAHRRATVVAAIRRLTWVDPAGAGHQDVWGSAVVMYGFSAVTKSAAWGN